MATKSLDVKKEGRKLISKQQHGMRETAARENGKQLSRNFDKWMNDHNGPRKKRPAAKKRSSGRKSKR